MTSTSRRSTGRSPTGSRSWSAGVGGGTPSDARCKEHVEPIQDALATVMRLRGVTFEWR